MNYTKEELAKMPLWFKNELKYAKVTLRDRAPGPVNRNEVERRCIDKDYHEC